METTTGFSPLKWLLVAIVAGAWLMLGFIAGARHERGEFLFLKSPAETAAPVAGEVWELRSEAQTASTRYGPWPRREFEQGNLILDVRDGWVRYNGCWPDSDRNAQCSSYGKDRRKPLDEFMRLYRKEIPAEVTYYPPWTYCTSSDPEVPCVIPSTARVAR